MNRIPFPKVFRVEPASQCNLMCAHCPTGTVTMERGLMPSAVFERVIEELELHKDRVETVVLYHGGEPLLNAKIYSMIGAIKNVRRDFLVKTVTNGMALTKSNSKKLISSDIDEIEISLDGMSAEESEVIRRKSRTSQIVRNIRDFIKCRHLANGGKKPKLSISTAQFVRNKNGLIPEDIAPPDVPSWLIELFGHEESVEFKTGWGFQWPHMDHTPFFDLAYSEQTTDRTECDHALNTITVRSDGNVVPCCYDLTSRLKMGNILERGLEEIWSGDRYQKLRSSIDKGRFISICNKCAVVKPPVYLVPKV